MISRERKHHTAVARQAEKTAVPDAENDEGNEHQSAVLTENVHKDLKDRLTVVRIDGDGCVEVLNREEEAEYKEEAKESGNPNGH
jgi:hypothetical protein